jgi:hypothetical protein
MSAKPLKYMKFGDFIIAGVVIAMCIALWINLAIGYQAKASDAEIVINGKIVLRYNLVTQKRNFEADDLRVILPSFSETKDEHGDTLIHMESNSIEYDLLLTGGKVEFARSNCPDQVCVHTGLISRSGEIAACVPANALVRIVKEKESQDPDVILK